MFTLAALDHSTKARRCRLKGHGVIETPAFIPVGRQGSVKAASPRELREMEAQIIPGNTAICSLGRGWTPCVTSI